MATPTPGKYNFKCFQGSTFQKTLTWKRNNAAIDITDYTMRLQARSIIDSSTVIIELTTENGGIELSDPTEGEFILRISAADTTDLTPGSYRYDLEVDTGVSVRRIMEGRFRVRPEITR